MALRSTLGMHISGFAWQYTHGDSYYRFLRGKSFVSCTPTVTIAE